MRMHEKTKNNKNKYTAGTWVEAMKQENKMRKKTIK